jgi:hypothetical protein
MTVKTQFIFFLLLSDAENLSEKLQNRALPNYPYDL